MSVILPTFNRLQYLQQAIDSVFAQTLTDWELIVADDGSDEQTRSYLATLESRSKVRILLLPRLGNPGAVRNVALREARGEHIAFLDSDDWWMPAKLELQVAALRESPDCHWSYTEHIQVNHAGESTNSRRNPNRVLQEGWIFERLLSYEAGVPMPTVMVRKTLLERSGGFDEQQGLHEDQHMWLRLALLSKIRLLREPSACIRRHNEHFSRGGIPSFEARRRVLEKVLNLQMSPTARSALRTERARNDAVLALEYAAIGDRGAVWRVLAGSWRHSWRVFPWYLIGAKAVARLHAPAWLVLLTRRRRERRRQVASLL